jgi:hypothetical protein
MLILGSYSKALLIIVHIFFGFRVRFVTTIYSLVITYMQSVFVNKVRYDGFPLSVVDDGLGIGEGGVGNGDGGFARFEVGHN